MKLNKLIQFRVVALFGIVLAISAVAAPSYSADEYRIPNVVVLDQDAQAWHFYDDLVKDKIVAINFIFTSCQMVCPLSGLKFAQLQKLINRQPNQISEQVRLISITTDVPYDTPQRLKEWAARFGAQPGWSQLSGDTQNITRLLKSLGAFAVDKEQHSTLVLVINDPLKDYKWVDGGSDPQTLLSAINSW